MRVVNNTLACCALRLVGASLRQQFSTRRLQGKKRRRWFVSAIKYRGLNIRTHVGNIFPLFTFRSFRIYAIDANKGSYSFLKTTAFWDVAPCTLMEVDRRFRGASCLHHQATNRPLKRRSTSTRQHGAASQKAVIFVLAGVRT
jgi:hypothetical protein